MMTGNDGGGSSSRLLRLPMKSGVPVVSARNGSRRRSGIIFSIREVVAGSRCSPSAAGRCSPSSPAKVVVFPPSSLMMIIMALIFFLAPVSVLAKDCVCDRYRCISGNGTFEYAVTDMLSEDAIDCVKNHEGYQINGACRYCEASCEENTCTCDTNNRCDWMGLLAAAMCLLGALPLCALGLWNSVRLWYVEHRVRSYELSEFPIEPWQFNWKVSVAFPLTLATMLIGACALLWRHRSTF